MKRLLLLCSFATLLFHAGFSQEEMSWRKHVSAAEKLYKQGKLGDAASHYEQAWKKKTSNLELIYLAGDCYYRVRDFRKAIDCLKHVKDENTKYPLVGMKYARSLKDDCQYDAASREFVLFINTYNGADKEVVAQIVQNEIRGCELGLKLAADSLAMRKVQVEHLSENINTPETEFAPIPFSDDILYFSSTMQGKARIFRSQLTGGAWSKAETPRGFPDLKEYHFGNGAFTPDASRFYYTQCQSVFDENVGVTSRCQIFVLKRTNSGWSDPLKLRDYINMDKATTTQPCIVQKDNKEIMYFSSDREGGYGGLDIWYCTRDISGDDIDFTLPINAGPTINTKGDEITPYYDAEEGALYFSSNGQVGIGGFDIFKSSGSLSTWNKVENTGMPLNSCTDDFYYVKNKSRSGGFLVSNRFFGADKVSTREDDIFSFYVPEQELVANGKIQERNGGAMILGARVSLYELAPESDKKLLNTTVSEEGDYDFALMPGKHYRIEVEKEGYQTASYEFQTTNAAQNAFGLPILMEKKGTAMPEEPMKKTDGAQPEPENLTSKTTLTPEKQEPKNAATPEKTKPAPAEKTVMPEKKEAKTAALPEKAKPAPAEKTVMPEKKEAKTAALPEKAKPAPVEKTAPAPAETPKSVAPDESVAAAPQTETAQNPDSGTPTNRKRNMKPDNEKDEVVTDAPVNRGVYYKIQLLAVKEVATVQAKLDKVTHYGRLDTEYIIRKDMTRVLLSDFFNFDDASLALTLVKGKGFGDAFIVRYEDGVRVRAGK